jgi:calcineurin-like phosphoesterase family protein
MSQTFFTSDLHLEHHAILEYTPRGKYLERLLGIGHCTRPVSMDDHNQWVVDTINETVGERDRIYFLGDLFMGGNQWIAGYWISKIKCVHKHLISGNHDESLFDFYCSSKLFETCDKHRTEIKLNGKRIILDHHPIAEWSNGHHSSWHLHGHSHGNFNYERANLHDKRILDVGWDNAVKVLGQYRPFNFEQVAQYMEGRISIEHHGKAD